MGSWVPSPGSPAPMALQDFIGHNARTSSTPEGSVSPLDTTPIEPTVQSSVLTAGVQAAKSHCSAPDMFHFSGGSGDHEGPSSQQMPTEQDVASESQNGCASDPLQPIADWRAIRVQLPVGKKPGSKRDWIRGWSDEVIGHSVHLHCACTPPPPEEPKRTSFGLNRRAIRPTAEVLQPSSAPQAHVQHAPPAAVGMLPGMCAVCGRPPPYAVTLPPDDGESRPTRSFVLRRKVSSFWQRVIGGRRATSSSSSARRAVETPARDAHGAAKTAMANPNSDLSKPAMVNQGETDDNNDAVVDPDDLSSSDNDGEPRGDAGLKEQQKGKERLARAQKLLNRSQG